MFRQHFVTKYKLTCLGIWKPTFKVLWLTKTGALLHFYLKILFWFFSCPCLLRWERFLKSYMFSQNKKTLSSWICSLAGICPTHFHEPLEVLTWYSVEVWVSWITFKGSRDVGAHSDVCARAEAALCAAYKSHWLNRKY